MLVRRLLLVLLILCGGILHSQQVAVLSPDSGLHHIAQYASYFPDSSGTLTIDQVSTPEMVKRFKPTGKTLTNFGVTKVVYWVRILITPTDHSAWCLQTEPALSDDFQFYTHTAGGWKVSRSGLNYAPEEREIPVNSAIFPLQVKPGDTSEFFLRIKSGLPLYILMKAGTTKDFWMDQFRDSLFAGVFFGIMLVMALYNLFLFITNRDRVYIYYVLYVLFSTVFISSSTGYSIVLPDIFRKMTAFDHVMFPMLLGVFAQFFTMQFLYTKKYAPRMHKTMWGIMCVVVAVFFVDFFNHQAATMLIQLMGLVFTVVSITVGITVLRAGYAPAKYYLLGFGIYTLGLSTYITLAVAHINTANIKPSDILSGSSAIEAIILSFAIGDKLNSALREKQAAQEEALQAAEENTRIVNEQNIILERKVDERTQEIQMQKAIIEEKNKDILDSIHYAKRIQRALLASDKLLKKNLPEYFVLYRPKDIVSGDFYWGDEIVDGKFLLLTGDCTGHGVPGAFMSLLNMSILHEITSGMKLTRPDEILNAQREAIITSLNPEGSEEISRDGMDCSLCSFDLASMRLEFACANNPVWILRNGEMIDFRPDKFPVGIHEGEKQPFTLKSEQLLKGDIVYAFTDGFADQFGGPKGKKFKYSRLKEHLLEIREMPMAEQKEKLEKTFDAWKGNFEQLDDVLLIGIKIT